MALPLDKLGSTYGPATTVIDVDRARAYAAATNDPNPAYEAGKVAPPVFGVVPVWPTMFEAVGAVVPAEAAMFIVHGEQDMHFHQPLVPGRSITTRSEAYSVRVGGSGTRFTVKVTSDDTDSGDAVLTQYVTLFVRGMTDGESGGPDKPGHDFPDEARARPVGEHSVHVDDDQTFRYRDASGDTMPIHVDDEVARSVGLPGIIAHGLCTMAMCSQSVIATVADGDPARLRRLAVRFAANVFPGNDVVTSIFQAGRSDGAEVYAFEATSAGAVVVKNGLAEVV
ncbi:MAG: MaoC family dehydratase N-terminal domain-containing protein [Acidimicrobiales bacterium]|nr:MaoC family dehydratase N-terminal domain-containing protein [Acidimicrobiales bacterium]